MINNNDLLIISVKPKYAEKIIEGKKTIELRKCAPKRVSKNDRLLLYVTSPVKELWGLYKIKEIIVEEPKKFWELYGHKTGISENEFENYYKNSSKAFGIEIVEIQNYMKYSIKLNSLRKLIPGFMPPQTYSYIRKNIINIKALKDISKVT